MRRMIGEPWHVHVYVGGIDHELDELVTRTELELLEDLEEEEEE